MCLRVDMVKWVSDIMAKVRKEQALNHVQLFSESLPMTPRSLKLVKFFSVSQIIWIKQTSQADLLPNRPVWLPAGFKALKKDMAVIFILWQYKRVWLSWIALVDAGRGYYLIPGCRRLNVGT